MRVRATLILVVCFALVVSCNKETPDDEWRSFLDTTQKQQTTIEQNIENEEYTNTIESNEVVQRVITRDFLEERYPDKIILTYMYPEPERWEGKKEHRYSDEQMIAVNDYLVEHEQDYILYFMPVEFQDITIDYVLDTVNGKNPPDIISSVSFNRENNTSTPKMIFNGVYENLDKYKDTEAYKRLLNAYPSGLYELSLYNGQFYGVKTKVFSSEMLYYFYDKETAEKYGIEKCDIEGKTLMELLPVVDKVRERDESNMHRITACDLCRDVLDFIDVNIFFDEYEREPVFSLECIGVDKNVDGEDVISITESEAMKDEWRAEYEMYQNGDNCFGGVKDESFFYINSSRFGGQYECFIESFDVPSTGKEMIKLDAIHVSQSEDNIEVVPGKRVYTTDRSGWSVINGVCSKSENKEKALEAIAYICSDENLSNIMVKGVEAVNYELKNYEPTNTTVWKSSGEGSLANQYLVSGNVMYDKEYIRIAAESMKDTKIATGIEGDYFDLTDYKSEVEAIKQVELTYMGTYDDAPLLITKDYSNFEEAWNEFDSKLKEAGIERVLAEINKQRKAIDAGRHNK